MEYCIDTLQSPLEIYVPLDISYDLYKDYATHCMNQVKEQKRQILKRHDAQMQNELI